MKIERYFTILIIILMLVSFNSCGNKDEVSGEKAIGGVNINKILGYLPENSDGLIIFDFNKAFKVKLLNDLFDKSLKKDKEPMEAFFQKMDLKNNLKLVAMSFTSEENNKHMYMSIAINYDKNLILESLKAEKISHETTNYEGKDIVFNKTEKQAFCFIDKETLILADNIDSIKKMIDTFNNKFKSIQSNNKIMSYINEVKGKGLIYLSIIIPEKDKKPVNAGMVNIDLSKAEAFVGYLDVKDNLFRGEFKLLCNDETANSQIASSLNGLKGIGAMFGPEMSELLNKINISSTPEFVKIDFEITEELINKVENKMKEKFAPKTESNKNNEQDVDPFKK